MVYKQTRTEDDDDEIIGSEETYNAGMIGSWSKDLLDPEEYTRRVSF